MRLIYTKQIAYKNMFVWLSGVALAALVMVVLSPAQGMAAPNQLDGTVYWDQNGNGVHDAGEPGLSNVRVRFGWNVAATVTDANGNYTLTGVSGTNTLEVHTGWFRTQCNDVTCPSGPGADNDFEVQNQLIRVSADATTGGTFDVGLVPDWGSNYPIGSFTTPRPVDVATRLSYVSGCNDGTVAQQLCSIGDTITLNAAFFNQGTGPISNPVFSFQLPLEHSVVNWYADGGSAHPDADTITTIQPFDPDLGYGIYRLNGTLPAGASSSMLVDLTVDTGATGTPTPYPTTNPRDKLAVTQILKIDQSGDPDSNFCLAEAQNYVYGTCSLDPLGVHNKLLPYDHSDSADWNLTGTVVPRVDSANLTAAIQGAPVDVCSASRNVTYTLTVANTSTGDTPLRNFEIALNIPSGTTFNLADNPGWFMGSDGRPHSFVNMPMLPGSSQEVPVVVTVNSSVTSADNGTAALQLGGEIVAYDTAQVTNQPDGTNEFNPGSMSGTLSTQNNITVVDDSCPDNGNGGSPGNNGTSASAEGRLADTGVNTLVYILGAVVTVGVSSLALYRRKLFS